MLFSLLGWPFCPLHGSFNTHGHSHCFSGRCLWKLPSHLHHVQPFYHQGQRSPQLLKDKVWIHLHKQSKSIALTVGGSAHVEYSRATPKIFHSWDFHPSWLQPSAPAWDGTLRPIPKVGCTNIPSSGVRVGRSSKGALGHPILTLVITSDLSADPA